MDLQALINLSRKYGSDPEFVLGGGGNTSFKQGNKMYVKASGNALGDISREGFVGIDLPALNKIWKTEYPSDPAEREERALKDLMDARLPEDRDKRPSVETLMHGLIPETYIAHTHPALINGVTCARKGAETVRDLFSGRAAWVPLVNPGYVLANKVREVTHTFEEETGRFPRLIFLQNHGVVAGSRTPEEVEELTDLVVRRVADKIKREPDLNPAEYDPGKAAEITNIIEEVFQNRGEERTAAFITNREIKRLVKNKESAEPVSSAYSPDHIVYAGHEPAWIGEQGDCRKAVEEEIDSYIRRNGNPPKIILVQNLGAFAAGGNRKMTRLARELFLDAVKIAVYSESFGGHRFMPKDQIEFIRNWEVEKYRENISKKE